ncbi:MAG TPA: MauE/DoxX family redox-associated membrane protein, partial [Acidobacteriota bacterium]|nr:MauE/DoxX family redox-associated membrane protein [Acidobacteriota bacterium]HPB28534.1 MauE/DoxX family redox-associated membrane protein [Acidobacteriota bacterium]HQO26030.1 MauE/DoxX family redox-associated membrane protein [Acidobacteriota bacterium]
MKLILNPIFQFLCRAVLGGVFIWASVSKIADPAAFAQSIVNYKIITAPVWVNLAAVILPWVELAAGVLLILNVWSRGAWVILTGLVLVFSVLIATTMVRGIDIACGCFGSAETSRVGLGLLVRDLALLVPAVLV